MNKPNRNIAAETTPSWIYIAVTIACVCFLAIGFFFAARQHFLAMDLGIKNSKLRKQLEDMEGENRRLVLAREVVRSPAEMKRIAARRGMRNADEVFAPNQASLKQSQSNPLVQKTSMTVQSNSGNKPVKAFYAPGTQIKNESKSVKKTVMTAAR